MPYLHTLTVAFLRRNYVRCELVKTVICLTRCCNWCLCTWEKKVTGKEVDHKVWKQDLPPPSQKGPALSWALLFVGRGLCLPQHRYCWCYDSAICPSHQVRVNCSSVICKAWGDPWSASAWNSFGNSQRIREGENCLNTLPGGNQNQKGGNLDQSIPCWAISFGFTQLISLVIQLSFSSHLVNGAGIPIFLPPSPC